MSRSKLSLSLLQLYNSQEPLLCDHRASELNGIYDSARFLSIHTASNKGGKFRNPSVMSSPTSKHTHTQTVLETLFLSVNSLRLWRTGLV